MIRKFAIFYATKETVLSLNHHILYILCLFNQNNKMFNNHNAKLNGSWSNV